MALYIISAKYQSNFRRHILNLRYDFGSMGPFQLKHGFLANVIVQCKPSAGKSEEKKQIRLYELFCNLNTTGLSYDQPNNSRVPSM